MSANLRPIAQPQLLLDGVVERLRTAILDGDLASGQRLSVPDLARTLGTSRTPVREALYALEQTGLVEIRPRRGAVVFGGGADTLAQMFELREALDGMAGRLAAERMSDDERVNLRRVATELDEALLAGDRERHLALDLAFHAALRDGAHNPRLAVDLGRLRDQMTIIMRSSSNVPGAMGRGTRSDHRAIARAALAGDADAAERAARKHVRNIAAFVMRARTPAEKHA